MATDDRMDISGSRGRAAAGVSDGALAATTLDREEAEADELVALRIRNLIYWAVYGGTRACARLARP